MNTNPARPASAHRRITRSAVVLGVGALTAATLAACTDKADTSNAIAITASDDKCSAEVTEAKTGRVVFTVHNEGPSETEFEIIGASDTIIGEVEGIGVGVDATLQAEITKPGTYTLACIPGMAGDGIRTEFTVTGDEVTDIPGGENVKKGLDEYTTWAKGEIAALVAATDEFVAAVKSGDLDEARALYAPTRMHWETIETVAESFGDIDPKVDMRFGDDDPFTGFHRIERFLWKPTEPTTTQSGAELVSADDVADAATDSPEAINAIADQLVADIADLNGRINDPGYFLAVGIYLDGSKGLIEEVASSKVTGEEERYSRTDVWDFRGNVDGAKKAIDTLRAALEDTDADLLAKIDGQFADIDAALDPLAVGDGFVFYDTLTEEQVADLSQKVDALAESLADVHGTVAPE